MFSLLKSIDSHSLKSLDHFMLDTIFVIVTFLVSLSMLSRMPFELWEDVTLVPLVWAMQYKCELNANAITKYKVCLNLHGGKQEFGVNYYKT